MLKILIVTILIFINQKIFSQDSVFTPYGKIWGFAFGDYFYKAGGDSLITPLEYSRFKKDDNGFEFRRIFFGYDYFLSKSFEAKFVLAYEGSELTSDGKRAVFVKDAYLKWKNMFQNLDLLFGIMPTPAYTLTTEKVWGYRSIEKTIMDQRGILSSRDFGIMLSGSFDKDKNVIYNIMAGNGRAGNLENNKHKKYYASLIFNFLKKKLITSVYSDYEPSGDDKYKLTLQAFAGYIGEVFSIGAESFFQHQKNFNTSGNTRANIIPFGISGFLNGVITKNKLKFFARYDYWDPNTETTSGFNQHFITLGIDYMPHAGVHIMPNLWLNAYQSENPSRKTDVVPRITFYYEYR